MGRVLLIGLVVFLAIAYIGIGFGMYCFSTRIVINNKPLIEHPVNEQTRTDKLGFGELFVYLLTIAGACIYAVTILQRGGPGSAILARYTVLPPVMALFNARKRTGKAMIALIVSFMAALFFAMTYFIIGLPQNPPVLTVNDTPIIVTRTTAGDLIKEGFEIYIRNDGADGVAYEDLLTSGIFAKYSADNRVYVEPGFHQSNGALPYADYLLVKDNAVLGSIGLYNHTDTGAVPEECKIIELKMDADCIAAARANSMVCTLNGIELLAPLDPETIKKTFGKHLWSLPDRPVHDGERYYGLHWTTNSNHLFWNEYYSTIHFDENNAMTALELSGEIAR